MSTIENGPNTIVLIHALAEPPIIMGHSFGGAFTEYRNGRGSRLRTQLGRQVRGNAGDGVNNNPSEV